MLRDSAEKKGCPKRKQASSSFVQAMVNSSSSSNVNSIPVDAAIHTPNGTSVTATAAVVNNSKTLDLLSTASPTVVSVVPSPPTSKSAIHVSPSNGTGDTSKTPTSAPKKRGRPSNEEKRRAALGIMPTSSSSPSSAVESPSITTPDPSTTDVVPSTSSSNTAPSPPQQEEPPLRDQPPPLERVEESAVSSMLETPLKRPRGRPPGRKKNSKKNRDLQKNADRTSSTHDAYDTGSMSSLRTVSADDDEEITDEADSYDDDDDFGDYDIPRTTNRTTPSDSDSDYSSSTTRKKKTQK